MSKKKHWYLTKMKTIPAQEPKRRATELVIQLDIMNLLTQKERHRIESRIVKRHIQMIKAGVVDC